MSSSGLLDIKRRIKTVQSTQKITKAMALVSTSKLRKVKGRLRTNDNYFSILEDIYYKGLLLVNDEENIFLNESLEGKVLYIVIASNAGLCGNFNGLAMQYLNESYEGEKENIELLIIGSKAISYAKKYKFNLYKTVSNSGDEFSIDVLSEIAKDIIEKFKGKEFNRVSLTYVKSISAVKNIVVEDQLLPIKKQEINNSLKTEIYNSEIKEKYLIEGLLYKYIEGKIINALANSRVSEETTRMNAMNSATKSGDEILIKLKGKYNRIRQSAITEEISEIIGGAEAQR